MDVEKHSSYVKGMRIGQIVAFQSEGFKMYSGKVISIENETILIETLNGNQFYASPEQIHWVKSDTNKRFPKHIYNLLKGGSLDAQRRKGMESEKQRKQTDGINL